MPLNQAVQYIEVNTFSREFGVTTTRRRAEPVGPLFEKFWQEYRSSVARETELSVKRKLELQINPQLEEFTRYPLGWNSYGAPPLRSDVKDFALSVLNSIMKARTPLPHVAPSSVGGLHVEWHEKGVDLELHIIAPYDCDVWFCDCRDPNAQPVSDKIATADFAVLSEPIDLLTSRPD
jgi:hypothetical protein